MSEIPMRLTILAVFSQCAHSCGTKIHFSLVCCHLGWFLQEINGKRRQIWWQNCSKPQFVFESRKERRRKGRILHIILIEQSNDASSHALLCDNLTNVCGCFICFSLLNCTHRGHRQPPELYLKLLLFLRIENQIMWSKAKTSFFWLLLPCVRTDLVSVSVVCCTVLWYDLTSLLRCAPSLWYQYYYLRHTENKLKAENRHSVADTSYYNSCAEIEEPTKLQRWWAEFIGAPQSNWTRAQLVSADDHREWGFSADESAIDLNALIPHHLA